MGQSARGASMASVPEKVALQATETPQSSNIAQIVSVLTRDDSNVDDVNAVDSNEPNMSVLQNAITVSVTLQYTD